MNESARRTLHFGGGAVVLEQRGVQGRLVIRRYTRWWQLATLLGIAACATGAAALWLAPNIAVTLICIGTTVVVCGTFLESPHLFLRGLVRFPARMEIVERQARDGAGYREASIPSSLFLRLPYREGAPEEVRHVMATTRFVSPKNSTPYYVYSVFLVVLDEVLHVHSFRSENNRDRLVAALQDWLRVTVKRATEDPSRTETASVTVLLVMLATLQFPQLYLLFHGPLAPSAAITAIIIALPLIARFAVVPATMRLLRPTRAEELSRSFGVAANRR